MKTNLSIQRGSHGKWVVVGKKTGINYFSGTRFDCAWQIGNNPEWRDEEEENYGEILKAEEIHNAMIREQHELLYGQEV